MDYKAHWSHIYQSKPATQVSWFQAHPQVSLDFIRAIGLDPSAQLIDVGAGASTLVDHLLDEGFHNITLLDLSGEALQVARERLGARGESITWIEGDVTRVELPEHTFDLWHDRAVFHFLTDAAARE